MTAKKVDQEEVLWPNQKPVVDGVTPAAEVSQEKDLFVEDEDGLMKEMED